MFEKPVITSGEIAARPAFARLPGREIKGSGAARASWARPAEPRCRESFTEFEGRCERW